MVVLLSTNYIAEGDYAEGEYYFLLLSSLLGMTVMASVRDLITIFVALELLSIPAYMLAGWRKRDLHGNEAGVKYYLMGVFASAVMLYGMSLLFGASGSTLLADIGGVRSRLPDSTPFITLGVVLVVIGFAFKVSAVPFHTWAPDTYEGAPTPITAFLAVLSKSAGFVALLQLILIAFSARSDVIEPLMWGLSALTMTVGNLIALRQTNIVRMLAYSGVAQAGFMLAPLAVVGSNPDGAGQAVITYLLIYAAMNLGAFAVVLAVARKTRSAEISTWGGLFEYAPGLTVLMTMFLFSLAGIPPLGGWLAKFVVFRSLLEPDVTAWRRHARGGGRRELGDRALLLRQRRQDDVDGPGPRRRHDARPGAVLPRRRPRHLDHPDGRLRRQQPRRRGSATSPSSSPRRRISGRSATRLWPTDEPPWSGDA